MKTTFILSLIVILVGSWFYYYRQTNFHTVIPGKFYRSAQPDAETLSNYINDHNIATVINLRGANPTDHWYVNEKDITSKLNTQHVDIRLTAYGQPKIHQVKEIIENVQSSPQPILFHCKAGADRSGLVSAIVLLLEGKQNIFDVEKQVSWRYLAIEERSTGKLFLAQYLQWLELNKLTHTPEIFLDWTDKNYVDDQGNLLYVLEQINGVIVAGYDEEDDDELPTVTLDRNKDKRLKISGWTINYIGETVAQKVNILLNQKPAVKMLTGISRPDVAKVYGHPNFTFSGWRAEQAIDNLENGCYDVQIELSRAKSKTWTSPPKAQICIN